MRSKRPVPGRTLGRAVAFVGDTSCDVVLCRPGDVVTVVVTPAVAVVGETANDVDVVDPETVDVVAPATVVGQPT